MPIFIKLGDIKGEVTAQGFKEQIALDSVQVGAGVAVGSATTKGGTRTASAASISELTVTKTLDNATPLIFQQLATGKSIGKPVIVTFTKASGKDDGGNDPYLIITMEDVFISGQSLSSGGDLPSESLSLNFTKIKFDYKKSDATGVLSQGSLAGWDLATNKSWA